MTTDWITPDKYLEDLPSVALCSLWHRINADLRVNLVYREIYEASCEVVSYRKGKLHT